MVWARTKLLIWDYVFEPVKEISIAYEGRHPEKLYKKLHELIRLVFNVPEGYIQEKDYRWEKKKDTDQFEIGWEITKIFDTYTYVVVELDFSGFVVAEGDGKAKIRLRPRIITEYPQDTIWQQSMIYEMLRRFWHKSYYHRKRMEYLYISKELVIEFERKIKEYMEEIRNAK
ncbi:MAG: hypothetical protein HY831_03095 [Candidatus Aenigmarchaeota archaeon]|nr:hypothetical protein [Candidatus Aenigmarchaeota archaeon]